MSGVNFTLDFAKRIVAAVKKIEAESQDLAGARNPSLALNTSFWAMVTGAADIKGLFHDWVAVTPSRSMATGSDSNILATNMWQFQTPYVAGFGNAREANDNREVPPGTVVMLTFIGYAIPDGTAGPGQGTSTVPASSTTPPAGADGSIPMYVFNYCAQSQQSALPIHDHRDNLTGGGFAFSVYHPGTALPQQPWSI